MTDYPTRPSAETGRPVLVVGVGDDGPAGLAPAILARVHEADVLVGGRRQLDLFATVQAERMTIADGLATVLAQVDAAAQHRRVVVLASGDPCFFGIGPLIAARLGRDRVEVVPHVSSVALAFARLGASWQDAVVVSAHGRPLDDAVHRAVGAAKLAVLTDESNTPAVVAEALLAAGAQEADAWVFEHLGGPHEASTRSSLAGLGRKRFAPLNVLVVPDLTWSAQAPSGPPSLGTARPADPRLDPSDRECGMVASFGLPESAYAHTAGLITKPEVRAVSLSKLRLPARGVCWDVGAGSGSVSIEAAGLAPDLTVYAVERSETQLDLLRANVQVRALEGRVIVVAGEAPAVLASLPDPDTAFIGGSGGHLIPILEAASARLRPGGRIVVNLVTFEHTARVLEWSRSRGFQTELVQVNVSRGTDVLGLTRLQAENAVTILTVER